MSNNIAILLESSTLDHEEPPLSTTVRNPATTTEYAEFEFDDSFMLQEEEDLTEERTQQHEPLLANTGEHSDEESLLEDGIESKHYKLPSEGGTIFSSFVSC